MKKNRSRCYQKPTISSEKVFEQAALACAQVAFDVPANLPNANLKVHIRYCGLVSS